MRNARCVATGDPQFFINPSTIKARCSSNHAMVYTENGTYTAVRWRAPDHCTRSSPEGMPLSNWGVLSAASCISVILMLLSMSVWDSYIRDYLETIYAFQRKKISGHSQTAYSIIKHVTGRYYLLNPWSRVLEKLTGFQVVKKFPVFYGTRRFITAFTSARHLSLSWASSIQSIPPHPTSWRAISILYSHLRLGLPSGIFPSGSPTKTLYTPLLSSIRATCPAHLILLDFITRTILGEQYRSLSSSLCSFFPLPFNMPLLGSNILLNTLFSDTLSLRSSLNVRGEVSHPYKTTCKIIVLYSTYLNI